MTVATDARLVSLNTGRPAPLPHRDRQVETSFVKASIQSSLWLGHNGLDGDEQADKKNHGGPDKAVCLYALEHYPYWEKRLGSELPEAAFGENFSTTGFTESEVCIGDVYRVGSATVQVNQPRQPCYKLAARHGTKELALWVEETGFTGFYLRCLEPGEVSAGDNFTLVERPDHGLSVAEANRVMHHDKQDKADIERLLSVPELANSWRKQLEKRLADL